MKRNALIHLFLIAGCSLLPRASGQLPGITCTGETGDLVVSADQTLDLPADGKLCFRNITVVQGATLRFRRNALNTPVYLLASGEIEINGSINVSGSNGLGDRGGLGGPGGFDGGNPGSPAGVPPGPGHGPGGGKPGSALGDFETPSAIHNGAGGFATVGFNGQLVADGSRYGNRYGTPILIPLIGGSGGGGATTVGGGGGGGAILIASNVRINLSAPGEIRADGGRSTRSGFGSGGAIRLVAPVVSGNGTLTANGGGSADVPFNPGRIRIDTLDRSTAAHQIFPASSTSFGAALVLGLDRSPQLHVLEAAGQSIPVGTGQPVTILLPSGSSPITNVVVEARGFSSSVPVQVALTPEHGQRRVYDGEIAVGANNSGRLTLPVEFLVNVPTLVQVWTR